MLKITFLSVLDGCVISWILRNCYQSLRFLVLFFAWDVLASKSKVNNLTFNFWCRELRWHLVIKTIIKGLLATSSELQLPKKAWFETHEVQAPCNKCWDKMIMSLLHPQKKMKTNFWRPNLFVESFGSTEQKLFSFLLQAVWLVFLWSNSRKKSHKKAGLVWFPPVSNER